MTFPPLALRRLVPAAALSCLAGLHAQTLPAPGDALAKLVPSDTLVYVQAPSLARLAVAIRRAATPFSAAQAESLDADELLGTIQFPGLLKQVDHEKPIAICFAFHEGEHAGPESVFLVPTLSVEEYVKSLKEKGLSATTGEGGYVAVALEGEAKPGPGPASIAVGLPAGDLVVRVDVDGLVERFRTEIDDGLDQMESALESNDSAFPMGIDPKPMMRLYADAVRAIVDSGQTLDVTVRLDGTRLELGEALTMHEKSALAEFGSKEKTDAKALARFIDPGASISMVMGLDMVTLTKRFQPFLDAVIGVYPEPFRTGLKPILAGAGDLAAQLGSAMCVSGDIGGSGLRAVYYLRPHDPAKLLALYTSMLRSIPGMVVDEPKDGEVDGVPVTRMRLHFSMQPLLAAQAKDLGEEGQAQMKAMVDKIYGKDGLAFTIATKGDVTALVIGGDDDYLRGSLARIAAGGTPPVPVALGLEQVGGLNPCFVTHYNLGRLMHGMQEMMGGLAPMPMVFPDLPASITAWGGVDGRVWRGAMSCDLAELAAALHALEPVAPPNLAAAQTAKAMADIRSITAALDHFALNNGGKFPDGLVVLVTPDANGQTYYGKESLPRDPWGREYRYDAPEPGHPRPRVYTYGKDGEPGGEGEDADIDGSSLLDRDK